FVSFTAAAAARRPHDVTAAGLRPTMGDVAERVAVVLPEQLEEVVDRDVDGAEDAPQRPAVERLVERHGDGRAPLAREAHVTALLPRPRVADSLEGGDALVARDHREWRHLGSHLDVDHLVALG